MSLEIHKWGQRPYVAFKKPRYAQVFLKTYLIFTLFAHHMIASSILFNSRQALCALLCIRRDPIRRLRVVRTLLEPQFHERANAGLVVGEGAAETEGVGAGTLDGGDKLFEFLGGRDFALDGEFTVGSRTPFQVRVVIHIRPHQ